VSCGSVNDTVGKENDPVRDRQREGGENADPGGVTRFGKEAANKWREHPIPTTTSRPLVVFPKPFVGSKEVRSQRVGAICTCTSIAKQGDAGWITSGEEGLRFFSRGGEVVVRKHDDHMNL
jgi:hypothetical protein